MYLDEFIQDALKLLSYNTVKAPAKHNAPFGKETKKALHYVLKKAKSLGFEVTNYDNYVGFAETGDKSLPGFDILGHLDTVPHGTGWTHSPLGELGQYNGKDAIYGRGALDDKIPIFVFLYIIHELKKRIGEPRKHIRVIFGCNEEDGWECMDHFKKLDKIAPQGFSPDADFPVVYYEKGIYQCKLIIDKPISLQSFTCGERANVIPDYAEAVYNNEPLKATGVSSHASTPEKGDNAGVKLLKLIVDKYADTDIAKLHSLLVDIYGSGFGINRVDTEGQALTMNVGAIKTKGTNLEIILDFRYPLNIEIEEINKSIQNAISGVNIVKFETRNRLFVNKDSKFITDLMDAYKNSTLDLTAQPLAIGGGTYARCMNEAVGFGPIFPDDPMPIHCVDECITIEQLDRMYRIYYEAIKNLCF